MVSKWQKGFVWLCFLFSLLRSLEIKHFSISRLTCEDFFRICSTYSDFTVLSTGLVIVTVTGIGSETGAGIGNLGAQEHPPHPRPGTGMTADSFLLSLSTILALCAPSLTLITCHCFFIGDVKQNVKSFMLFPMVALVLLSMAVAFPTILRLVKILQQPIRIFEIEHP